jgi:hypothetical protein
MVGRTLSLRFANLSNPSLNTTMLLGVAGAPVHDRGFLYWPCPLLLKFPLPKKDRSNLQAQHRPPCTHLLPKVSL